MNTRVQVTFSAICGAALAPALQRSEADAGQADLTVMVYAACADRLCEKIEAGETASGALATWIADAEEALTAYRAERARFALIDQRLAWAAPQSTLQAIAEKLDGPSPDIAAIAAAPTDSGPISRLIAEYALAQSPRAQALEAELAAGGLAVVLTDEDRARQGASVPRGLDALAAEIRETIAPATAHAALQAEAAMLRDMLDHAQGRREADATRMTEQARKIEAQHGVIRGLERELGEARGAVRQMQNWLKDAAAS